jgi:hypothetical protein
MANEIVFLLSEFRRNNQHLPIKPEALRDAAERSLMRT